MCRRTLRLGLFFLHLCVKSSFLWYLHLKQDVPKGIKFVYINIRRVIHMCESITAIITSYKIEKP